MKLRQIDLSTNHFTGSIPSAIGNMSSLEVLKLQENFLTGPFPIAILNISSLTIIALTKNHVSGTLPMDLCIHCPKLHRLHLSINELAVNSLHK
ncbi:hypothetical protein SLA2020_280600 [Shorea laevis]